MTGTRLRHALTYATRGWPVFPCQIGQKTPATAHGYLDATTDPAQITAWVSPCAGRRGEPIQLWQGRRKICHGQIHVVPLITPRFLERSLHC